MPVQKSAFESVDFYFFGYDGLLSNAHAAASFLFNLLDDLGNDPGAILKSPAQGKFAENRKQGYRTIILVSHSLGAVVTRWALLRAVEEKSKWLDCIRTLYFAPAHRGSNLSHLWIEKVERFPWLKVFAAGMDAKLPLILELNPESALLRDLEKRTNDLLPNYPQLRATCVVIAEWEIVVNNWIFAGDPFPWALRGTDHSTVCKPTKEFPEPVLILEKLL